MFFSNLNLKTFLILTSCLIYTSGFAQWNTSFEKTKTQTKTRWIENQFDNPDLAAEYEYKKTTNPSTNQVPYEQLYKAIEYTQAKLKLKAAVENTSWVERGPQNVSGRTRAIMFDPNYDTNNKVWAAGITGGLWYNTDVEGNGEWHNIGDFWDNIAVSTLAYDPNSPNIFYAGTGEGWTQRSVRGAGIWRSTDSGNTWARLASTDNANFHNTQKIIITSSSRIIASTNEGLFYSDNMGVDWTQVLSGFFGDIELSSNGTLFTSQGERYVDGTVYRSTDNGDTWVDLEITTETTQRTELASAPSNPNIIYAVSAIGGDVSWFKKSTDGGDNWTDISIPMYLNQNCTESSSDFARGQAWYDLIMRVHPDNEDMVYVGGIDWHKTSNGGANWNAVSYWTGGCEDYIHADQHAMEFFPNDNSKALVGSDGGVFYVTDMVNDFVSTAHVNNNYNVTQFYACAMENEAGSNYMLAGAQDNGTQKFTQSGFGATSQATGGDGAFCFIDQDNSDIQITSYVYNNWRISTNGGQNFSYYPQDYSGQFINPADYDSEENVLYASSYPDSIFVSDIYTDGNSGQHLAIANGLNNAVISTIKVSPFSTDVIYVGSSQGDIFRITDATNSPSSTEIDPSGSLPIGWMSSIDIGEDENQILVTYSSYGLESVWETRNGGTTWSNIEHNLPDMPVRGCLYNPNNTNQILLATELGVWSINNITTETEWEPSNTGLANVRCDQLKYRTSDKMVAVATYGRGLFTSDVFADPEPLAYFEANTTVSCPTDTVHFTDLSTKNPTSWTWNITPTTVTFANGTDINSQNPSIIFNEAGLYTVELTASNSEGSGNLVKTNYIEINDDCRYIMNGDDIVACEGTFYDPSYTDDYANGEDYTVTIYPENSQFVELNFVSFDVEYESNCGYDYLSIYDGVNTNAPLIGKYCGTNSPGLVTGEGNAAGALTFKFHSDTYSTGSGWVAEISCELADNINENIKAEFEVYPNPAKDLIKITGKQLAIEHIEILDIRGRSMAFESTSNTNESITIHLNHLEEGIYLLKVNNEIQKLIIE